MMDAYVYTRNYKTGKINEYYGRLEPHHYGRCCMFYVHNSRKYLTDVSTREGEPRRCSVWFLESNYEEAKILLEEHRLKTAKTYNDRAARICDSIMFDDMDLIYHDDETPEDGEIELPEVEE